MKKIKLIYVSVLLALFALSSCKNYDPIVQENQATLSLSAKTSLEELKSHFNNDGTLSRTSDNGQSDNPIGNILFDYCFDFEYPVTFSYNTGATVTVNDFNGLIDILVNMTDALYVDGVVFPFNVTVFDEATDSIVVQTINNEAEFETLVSSCGFDQDPCEYTDDFNPVCIAIQDSSGETFTVEFPNMSYVICEGFTQNDVVECDTVVDPGVDNNDCFDFVYPLSVVLFDGTTVVIQSDDVWETIMYTNNGGFDFVYPFTVELEDGSIVTIANAVGFGDLLATCYGDYNPCNCPDVYEPVCVTGVNGETIEFPNFCLAQCEGFTQNDIVDCSTSSADCWTFVYPVTISVNGVDTTVNTASEMDAIIANAAVQYQIVYPVEIVIDSQAQTLNTPNDFYEIGEWDAMCD